MPAWTLNNFIRTPLLLMALVESFILFSSVYVAAFVVFGNIQDGEQIVGWLAPKGANSFGSDQDDVVLMPYTSAMKRLAC